MGIFKDDDQQLEELEEWVSANHREKSPTAAVVLPHDSTPLYRWTSVKESLPKPGEECLVYGPRGIGSEGGPYFGVAVLHSDGHRWGSLRYFEARDDLGVLSAVGHRRIDIRREWHGVQVSHWMKIKAPDA
jgi:hypothetical protein